MELPRGIRDKKKIKNNLKGHLAHPVPPPSLPRPGPRAEGEKRVERRRGARGGTNGSEKMAIDVQVRKGQGRAVTFSTIRSRGCCDAPQATGMAVARGLGARAVAAGAARNGDPSWSQWAAGTATLCAGGE